MMEYLKAFIWLIGMYGFADLSVRTLLRLFSRSKKIAPKFGVSSLMSTIRRSNAVLFGIRAMLEKTYFPGRGSVINDLARQIKENEDALRRWN